MPHIYGKIFHVSVIKYAHLTRTSPPGGDGVNVAMYDSLELAQQIVKLGVGNLDEAVVNYEKLMFPRAKCMIEESTMTNEGMFSEDSPAPLLKMFSEMMQSEARESAKA
jgi:2-polyprenyl-6-methoxyphenol hydroxylase-like FAD-dependent oxidoreductase